MVHRLWNSIFRIKFFIFLEIRLIMLHNLYSSILKMSDSQPKKIPKSNHCFLTVLRRSRRVCPIRSASRERSRTIRIRWSFSTRRKKNLQCKRKTRSRRTLWRCGTTWTTVSSRAAWTYSALLVSSAFGNKLSFFFVYFLIFIRFPFILKNNCSW